MKGLAENKVGTRRYECIVFDFLSEANFAKLILIFVCDEKIVKTFLCKGKNTLIREVSVAPN